MLSLSEDIRDKLDQMRQVKRDNYEKYLKQLVAEQRLKTENAQKIYHEYEEAIREYQRLIESRHESVLSMSRKNSALNSASKESQEAPIKKDSQLLSPEDNSENNTVGSEKNDTPATPISLERSISQLATSPVDTIAADIKLARENCDNLKKDYAVIDSSLRLSHQRIATARDEYYQSLLEFNKLENSLVRISSKFEENMKLELDKNIPSINNKKGKDFDLKYPDIISDDLSESDVNTSKKRKPQYDFDHYSKYQFGRRTFTMPKESVIKNIAPTRPGISSQIIAPAAVVTSLVLLGTAISRNFL